MTKTQYCGDSNPTKQRIQRLLTGGSARVHIESKKEVRNYDVNDRISLLYILTR